MAGNAPSSLPALQTTFPEQLKTRELPEVSDNRSDIAISSLTKKGIDSMRDAMLRAPLDPDTQTL